MSSTGTRRATEPQPRVGSVTTGPLGAFAGTSPAPWLVLGIVALVAVAGGAVWLAGSLAGVAGGRGWHPPAFGVAFYVGLARGHLRALFPGVELKRVWVATGLLAVVVLVPAVTVAVKLARRRIEPGDPLASLARPDELARLTTRGLAGTAGQLRPSLAGRAPKTLTGDELGVPLGTLMRTRTELRASWEDVLLAVMAPRAGKTTALAVPAVLDAPGPVLATSNKADLWAVTRAARAEQAGRDAAGTGATVWTFDPQQITYTPRTWWWDPLAEVATVEDAHRLAGHFLSANNEQDFWDKAALELLTALILAAAGSGGTLADVYGWLTDSAASAPVRALEAAGHTPTARALRGAQAGVPETREGIYQTARTAAQALQEPRIMAWVTPPAGPGLPAFAPAAFATSTDTLYLLSKDGAGSAAPLVAALTDAVFRAATRAAERAGGRLDPPLVAVLDEAANICRIADLPELYSHLGSRGIVPVTILQSHSQGVRVWGEAGMAALWSAATVKLIGAGIDDARTAEDLSRLVGEHDVPVSSMTRTAGGTSTSTSLRRQRILGPDEIRALPKGAALLFATGARAALVHLAPWYAGPRAAELDQAMRTAQGELTRRAQAGPGERAAT